MFYLIHGDDIVASRNKLNELVSPSDLIVWLNNKNSLADIDNALSSQELFATQKAVIIENILGFSAKDLEKIIKLVERVDVAQLNVIFWQDEEIGKKDIYKFKKATVLAYSLPKYFYEFLDNLAPSSGKKLFNMFSKMSQFSDEQIFYAIVKRIRQLMMLKTKGSFEEIQKMKDWQKQKLNRQAAFWQERELVKFYNGLFELEMGLKTSELTLPLRKHLDILLIREL